MQTCSQFWENYLTCYSQAVKSLIWANLQMIQTDCYWSQSRCASCVQYVCCYWLTDGKMGLNGPTGPPWRGPLRILLCAHCQLSEVISGLSVWSREEVQEIQIRSIQQHFFRTVTLLWRTALYCLREGERRACAFNAVLSGCSKPPSSKMTLLQTFLLTH